MKRISAIYWLLSAMILASCVEENLGKEDSEDVSSENLISKTFSATLEGGSALRSSLQGGADFGKVYWEKGDQMTILALSDGIVSICIFNRR